MTQTSRGKLDRLRRTPAGSTLCALDGYGLRSPWPARPTLAPRTRFLFIGSRLCSALPSDPASRLGPGASLTLRLHQAGWRTCTSELSSMLGTPRVRVAARPSPRLASLPPTALRTARWDPVARSHTTRRPQARRFTPRLTRHPAVRTTAAERSLPVPGRPCLRGAGSSRSPPLPGPFADRRARAERQRVCRRIVPAGAATACPAPRRQGHPETGDLSARSVLAADPRESVYWALSPAGGSSSLNRHARRAARGSGGLPDRHQWPGADRQGLPATGRAPRGSRGRGAERPRRAVPAGPSTAPRFALRPPRSRRARRRSVDPPRRRARDALHAGAGTGGDPLGRERGRSRSRGHGLLHDAGGRVGPPRRGGRAGHHLGALGRRRSHRVLRRQPRAV